MAFTTDPDDSYTTDDDAGTGDGSESYTDTTDQTEPSSSPDDYGDITVTTDSNYSDGSTSTDPTEELRDRLDSPTSGGSTEADVGATPGTDAGDVIENPVTNEPVQEQNAESLPARAGFLLHNIADTLDRLPLGVIGSGIGLALAVSSLGGDD